MPPMTTVAEAFFVACETGKGWEACSATARHSVVAYAVFHDTHTGDGGLVPPAGRRTSTDYVYVMRFEGEKIAHLTKVWHAGLAMKELGWA